MSDAYEAGAEPDAEMQAFLEKEETAPQPSKEYSPADDERLTAAPKEPEPKQEPNQALVTQEPGITPEDEASAMGWAPKDQWRGDPDKWVDAETFLSRADSNPKMLRERLRTQDERYKKTIASMERMNQQALERQRAELDAERDALIQRYAGDPNAIRQINANYEQATQQIQAPVPEAQLWIQEHPRYTTDTAFNMTAQGVLTDIERAMPNATQAARFAELDQRLAKIYPDEFKGALPAAGAVPPAGGRQIEGVRVSGAGRKSNYSSRLPAAAKAQGERFVKNGDFKNIEEYAREYFDA